MPINSVAPAAIIRLVMLLPGSIFLLVVGGGSWSIDRQLISKAKRVDS